LAVIFILIMLMSVGRISARGGNSSFFLVMAKSIFTWEDSSCGVSFYQLETKRKIVLLKS